MLELVIGCFGKIPNIWLFACFTVTVILGVALLLYGRVIGRSYMVLIGAGVGLALAKPFAVRAGFNPLGVQIALPIILAAAGVLLGPVAWAVVMGFMFAGAGGSLTVWRHWPEVFEKFYAAVAAYAGEGEVGRLREFKQAFGTIWRGNSREIMIVAAVSMATIIMVGLLKPMITTIFMSSLVGAFQVLAGTSLIFVAAEPTMSQRIDQRWYVLVILMLALMLFGIVFQFCGDIRAARRRAEKEREQEQQSQKAQSRTPANAE